MSTPSRFLCSAHLAALALVASSHAQGRIGDGQFEVFPFDEPGFEGMVYHVFTPKTVKKGRRYPLVFALHGNGQNAKTHVRKMSRVSSDELPVFIVAPQYQKGPKFNNPRYPNSPKAFAAILNRAVKGFPVDRGRMVLQGFSMGSNYSTAWINAWIAKGQETFPFRAVWLNGTAVTPDLKAPRIPYLLFVGEKETAVLGRINVVAQVRRTYVQMFRRKHDVWYIEIPGMGHSVNAECHRIMRNHLAGFADYSQIAPAKLLVGLGTVEHHCATRRFDSALKELDRIIEKGPLAKRGKARTLRGKLVAFLKKRAAAIKKLKRPTVGDYLELKHLGAQLQSHAALTKSLQSAIKKLESNKALQAELQTWREFGAARKRGTDDPQAGTAALKLIADGPDGDTEYGRRARAHMQALGQAYSFPFAADVAGNKRRKVQRREKRP